MILCFKFQRHIGEASPTSAVHVEPAADPDETRTWDLSISRSDNRDDDRVDDRDDDRDDRDDDYGDKDEHYDFLFMLQGGMYSGAVFIQQSVGWNMYLSIVSIVLVTAVYTIVGQYCYSHCCLYNSRSVLI